MTKTSETTIRNLIRKTTTIITAIKSRTTTANSTRIDNRTVMADGTASEATTIIRVVTTTTEGSVAVD